MKCRQCNSKCNKIYCDNICQQRYQSNQKLVLWKCGKLKGHTGKTFRIRSFVRDYLFYKYGYKCCQCGWSEVNSITKRIPLEVNHIDGNAANSWEDNLNLLCPNCHSLTPNFRNLNSNSVRLRT